MNPLSSWIHLPGSQPLPTVAEVGGKAFNLARLQESGAEVPTWVAIRAAAFNRLVLDGRPWTQTAEDAAAMRAEVLSLELPPAFRATVLAALEEAGLRGRRLAVRSSAMQEDGAGASFAGQFESVLGVCAGADGVALWEAVRRVWASAFSAHATAYRQQQTADAGRLGMAVILQEMVDAEVSGVAFSTDPVSGPREVAVVSAAYGLGEGLVSGELDADSYRVAFAGGTPGEVRREIVAKESAYRLLAGGGTAARPVPRQIQELPALTDAEVIRIAAEARRLAERFGVAQDVEWALVPPSPDPSPTRGEGRTARDGGAPRRLVILQARPITTLPAVPPVKAGRGERRIWDNSNIIESYSGVTAPLTFSFARGVYEDVYRQFCRLMGVSEPLLERHRHVFASMLGLVRGRVYYNLLNWYRVLALLPGYAVNREFMERMMGVREKLADPPATPPVAGRWEDVGRLARMVGRLIREQRRLKEEVPAFHARVDAALAPLAGQDLSAWTSDELVGLYRRLEESLLRHWRAPLVNDFFAMIAFGLLVRLIEKWLPEAPPTLANDLLCGEGEIISTEPARRVMALAGRVAREPALAALFAAEPDDAALWRRLAADPEFLFFHRKLQAYLERFGDRCMNELKLETVTLSEDPGFLLQMIRAYAAQGVPDAGDARERELRIRRDADAAVHRQLRGVRRRLFQLVLRQARLRVRHRENLRFERTRVFGVVRRIFLGLGGHLKVAGRLDSPRDIFYLTVEEVFAHFEGTAATTDLRGLAKLRRAEFDGYLRMPAPPERFETYGAPTAPPELTRAAEPLATDDLQGTGCCPGVVRAPVRIVRDPREARDLAGHILVAERTDPGWTLLFPAVRGLLVQRGSLLSHSAIVAREMGIPCIVAIPQLLEMLQDGDVVEMDGATGGVRRVPPSPGPSPTRGEGRTATARQHPASENESRLSQKWERGLGGEGLTVHAGAIP